MFGRLSPSFRWLAPYGFSETLDGASSHKGWKDVFLAIVGSWFPIPLSGCTPLVILSTGSPGLLDHFRSLSNLVLNCALARMIFDILGEPTHVASNFLESFRDWVQTRLGRCYWSHPNIYLSWSQPWHFRRGSSVRADGWFNVGWDVPVNGCNLYSSRSLFLHDPLDPFPYNRENHSFLSCICLLQ